MFNKFPTGAKNTRNINQRRALSGKCAMNERKISNVAQTSVKFFIDMLKKKSTE